MNKIKEWLKFRNAGDFLKKLVAVVLIIAVVISIILLIKELAEPTEKFFKYMSKGSKLTSKKVKNVLTLIGAAWTQFGITVVASFVGASFMYAVGDIADNVWGMANRSALQKNAIEEAEPAEEKKLTQATVPAAKESQGQAVAPEAKSDVAAEPDCWICTKCGAKNKASYGQCKKCASYRGK